MAEQEQPKIRELKHPNGKLLTQEQFEIARQNQDKLPSIKGKYIFKDKRTGKFYVADSVEDKEDFLKRSELIGKTQKERKQYKSLLKDRARS